MMKQIVVMLAVLMMGLQVVCAKPLILSVHPFIRADEVKAKFTPLANYLGERIGRKIVVKVGANYDDHIQAIGSNQVDLAYMGPVSYVTLVRKFGKKPLLARMEMNGHPTFQGVIVVRKDSPYKTLKALRGKPFAFGDPRSTMSYVVPYYMLMKAGVIDKTHDLHAFLGSHENVALAVLSGDYAAGALKPTVYMHYKSQGLRVLATSPKISEHVFVARNGLKKSLVDNIRNVMLNIKHSSKGMAALRDIRPTATGLDTVKDSDYDVLRTIVNSLPKSGG